VLASITPDFWLGLIYGPEYIGYGYGYLLQGYAV